MRTWLLSSLTLFLPAAVSGALWQKLPNQVVLFLPDIDSCSKAFFVFGLPMLSLVVHFLFVGLCAITPWLRDVKTDLPRPGFWWVIPIIVQCSYALSLHTALDGNLLMFLIHLGIGICIFVLGLLRLGNVWIVCGLVISLLAFAESIPLTATTILIAAAISLILKRRTH